MGNFDKELVIVGAGISGLGFAHLALRRGLAPLLFESTDRVGGSIHSHSFATPDGTYWAELGAHTCYNSYGTFLEVLESLGMLERLRAKRNLPYRLLADGRLIGVPGALSYLPLIVSAPRILWLRRKNTSVREFFGGIVGRKNYEQAIGPALDALTCQPADDLPADLLFVSKPRRKDVLRNFSGPIGLSSLVDPIAAQPGVDLRLGVAVESVEKQHGGYRLRLSDGSTVTTETLVLAVEADTAARLVRGLGDDLAAACAEISTVEINSVAVMFEAQASDVPPVGGIIGRGDSFYSAASRDVVPDPDYRAFTFHFRPGIDPRQGVERACEVLGLGRDARVQHVYRKNCLPALRKGHAGWAAAVKERLADGRLGLVGNYFHGMGIEDCLCRAAEEFGRLYRHD